MNRCIEVNPQGCKDLESIRLELGLNVLEFCEIVGVTRASYYRGVNGGDNRLTPLQWASITALWLKKGKNIESLIGEIILNSIGISETTPSSQDEQRAA